MFLLWIKILQKFYVNKINKELTKGLKKVQLEKKLEVKIKVRTKILGKNERATFMIIWPIMLSL